MPTKWNAHPLDNYLPDNSSYEIPPGQLPPRLTPLNNYPQIIRLWKTTFRTIAPMKSRPRQLPLGFCPPLRIVSS